MLAWNLCRSKKKQKVKETEEVGQKLLRCTLNAIMDTISAGVARFLHQKVQSITNVFLSNITGAGSETSQCLL